MSAAGWIAVVAMGILAIFGGIAAWAAGRKGRAASKRAVTIERQAVRVAEKEAAVDAAAGAQVLAEDHRTADAAAPAEQAATVEAVRADAAELRHDQDAQIDRVRKRTGIGGGSDGAS